MVLGWRQPHKQMLGTGKKTGGRRGDKTQQAGEVLSISTGHSPQSVRTSAERGKPWCMKTHRPAKTQALNIELNQLHVIYRRNIRDHNSPRYTKHVGLRKAKHANSTDQLLWTGFFPREVCFPPLRTNQTLLGWCLKSSRNKTEQVVLISLSLLVIRWSYFKWPQMARFKQMIGYLTILHPPFLQ